ncbi:MAG: HdeD family acid-resistance protein [Candidatus Dependentiae bacterium]|nr:HdeD family acid-resistance protein [Candidatus Dependentiae bacterium]
MQNINHVSLAQLKKNWAWYFALGVTLNIIGTLAIIFAFVSTIFSVIYLGTSLVILGFFEGIQSVKLHQLSRFFLHLMLSILCITVGLYVIFYPAANAISLTLLLAIFFIISGILKIVFPLATKVPHAGWLALNGAFTLLLGILIFQQWPESGLWVLGMFVGIDMLFTGWNWIILSLAAKNLKIENVH